MDPFGDGIEFSVRPPKKSWKQIQNLSGGARRWPLSPSFVGEKTLSSLALVFALHHYKPTPLYVMDEIDAALDFRNVSILAHYIKERTQNAQFIIISLRNNMFELADRLVGIYKTFDCTKHVVIDPQMIPVGMTQQLQPQRQQQSRENGACQEHTLLGEFCHVFSRQKRDSWQWHA
jgi:structural maintenance of chromosome 4